MDYEKKYKDAMERAKQGLPMNEVFPELVESEDERIRKEIMEYLTITREMDLVAHPERQRWIAYLEKQPGDDDRYMEGYMNGMNDTLKEQKPVINGHKFHIGDTVTNGEDTYTINYIGNDCYGVKENYCITIPFEYEDMWKLIEQKPADVSEKIEELCSKYPLNKDVMSEEALSAYHQGLTFGATRIAEYLGAQKHTEWSEEDEQVISAMIRDFESEIAVWEHKEMESGKSAQKHINIYKGFISFIKSLRPQPKQEWSEGEMKVLDSIIDDYEKAAKSFCGYDGKIMLLKAIRNGEYGLSKQERSEEEKEWIRQNGRLDVCYNPEKYGLCHKIEWSEEDEEKLSAVISLMKSNRAVNPFYDKVCLESWLKFLPKRFILHPKQVWDEGDRNRHYYLCKLLRETWDKVDKGSCIDDAITWLENLPEQIYPHSWKPSEEQMEVMEYYIHTLICNRNKEILFGLYNDLKKL